jgi:hypothetical protein
LNIRGPGKKREGKRGRDRQDRDTDRREERMYSPLELKVANTEVV